MLLTDLEKIQTLGTGGFARVYLVRDKNTLKYYAMKIMRKALLFRMKQVEHTYNEKEILLEVDFSFIVKLYEVFQDRRNIYFLFEYVCGGEIFSLLRDSQRFPRKTARFYASEIVVILEHLHSKNIVYRDLKPENLLIDSYGHIKLTDFGFAKKIVGDDFRTYTLCGTPEYMAPEVIKGKGYGLEVDWWSLGILIYEMLAGYPPFYDEDPSMVYEKILYGSISFPSHFDGASRDIILKLLYRDRTKRYGNLKAGTKDIKDHPFFKKIDWNALASKRVTPPFRPNITNEGDTSYFEKYEEEYGFDAYYLSNDIPDPYATEFKDF